MLPDPFTPFFRILISLLSPCSSRLTPPFSPLLHPLQVHPAPSRGHMSRGSKHLLLERDFVSAALPLRARSPSVARRQYGHALPGEEVGHGPRREALLDFILVSVSRCECLSRVLCSRAVYQRLTELHLAMNGIRMKDGERREAK